MGVNKALIEIQGQPMVSRSVAELAAITDEILISSNDPAPYAFMRLPVIPDLYPGQGPLAGLHAALVHTRRSLVLLLACDLPLIHSGLLLQLVRRARGYDAVVPRTSDERVHPLCAVYRRTCLKRIDSNLASRQNKMTAFLEDPSLKVNWLKPAAESFANEDRMTLNSPQELEAYLASMRK
jgi:molybdopterin-guanine dinucleotide biosynthesis protein A